MSLGNGAKDLMIDRAEIGRRAVNEVLRICGEKNISVRYFLWLNRIPKSPYERWMDGSAPSAVNLAVLKNAGADIDYILTGERRNDGNKTV